MRELLKEGYCAIAGASLLLLSFLTVLNYKKKPTSFYFYTSQCECQCPAHTGQREAITIMMTVRITTAHLTVNLICWNGLTQQQSHELDPTASPKEKNQHFQRSPAIRPAATCVQPVHRREKQSWVPPLRS